MRLVTKRDIKPPIVIDADLLLPRFSARSARLYVENTAMRKLRHYLA